MVWLGPALAYDSFGLMADDQLDCYLSFCKLGLWDKLAIFKVPLKSFNTLGGLFLFSKFLASKSLALLNPDTTLNTFPTRLTIKNEPKNGSQPNVAAAL